MSCREILQLARVISGLVKRGIASERPPVGSCVRILVWLAVTAGKITVANAEPAVLRLSTYNLWHGLGPARFGSYVPIEAPGRIEERQREQLEILSREAPDVAFFQETNTLPRRAIELARALSATVVYQTDAAGLKLFGVGIPSAMNGGLALTVSRRYTSRKVGALPLSHRGPNLMRTHASLQFREERFALMSEIRLPDGAKILLVNTHLHDGFEASRESTERIARILRRGQVDKAAAEEIWRRIARGNLRRRREVSRMLGRIKELEARYDAIVIAGDFNSGPEGETYRMMKDAGYRDAWTEANADEPGLTFDFDRNRINRLCQSELELPIDLGGLSAPKVAVDALVALVRKNENSSRRIDYIWIKARSGRARVRGARLFGAPAGITAAASDHFGLTAEIEF